MLATGFAVLLGFVVFLAFESFDTSRSGAETEAQIVREQFETAQLFPEVVRARLSAELVCYARAVVHSEWPKMQAGTLEHTVNPWTLAMFRITKTVRPQSPTEQAAYAKWLDQRTDRETARGDRTHVAMERTVRILGQEAAEAKEKLTIPCNALGSASSG